MLESFAIFALLELEMRQSWFTKPRLYANFMNCCLISMMYAMDVRMLQIYQISKGSYREQMSVSRIWVFSIQYQILCWLHFCISLARQVSAIGLQLMLPNLDIPIIYWIKVKYSFLVLIKEATQAESSIMVNILIRFCLRLNGNFFSFSLS